MNRLEARVEKIEETDVVTYIHVTSGGSKIILIKSSRPAWLFVGDKVLCSFPEASVNVSKDCPGKVSIENRFPATLAVVRQGASLCELTFESDFGTVVSLITANAYEELGLEEGCRATMLLRGMDINVEPVLVPTDLENYSKIVTRTKVAN